jgi:hypothetical protein
MDKKIAISWRFQIDNQDSLKISPEKIPASTE